MSNENTGSIGWSRDRNEDAMPAHEYHEHQVCRVRTWCLIACFFYSPIVSQYRWLQYDRYKKAFMLISADFFVFPVRGLGETILYCAVRTCSNISWGAVAE